MDTIVSHGFHVVLPAGFETQRPLDLRLLQSFGLLRYRLNEAKRFELQFVAPFEDVVIEDGVLMTAAMAGRLAEALARWAATLPPPRPGL